MVVLFFVKGCMAVDEVWMIGVVVLSSHYNSSNSNPNKIK